MIAPTHHEKNHDPLHESWDVYADRFIASVTFTIPWGDFHFGKSWGGRALTIHANNLRDNSPGMRKFGEHGVTRGEWMDPNFNIGHLDLTGYWLNDLEHLREVFEWYALHEIREQIWVDGERPWHPHKGVWSDENEESWNRLANKWAEAPTMVSSEVW